MSDIVRPRRWLVVLLIACCAVVSMGCLGWAPPMQTVSLDGGLGPFTSSDGRWYTVGVRTFEPDLVLRGGSPASVEVRLMWNTEIQHARIDHDRLHITASTDDGHETLTFELTRIEGGRISMMGFEDGHAMWRLPWIFERVSSFELVGRRVARVAASAYDETIDLLASWF
ncbi:MAG: hypothetical protein AAGE94_07195 [Acidobacteriota bacterium]